MMERLSSFGRHDGWTPNYNYSIISPQRGSFGGVVGHLSESDTVQPGNVDRPAPDHSCKYRWLRAPATP
jgi:hypothetical protein